MSKYRELDGSIRDVPLFDGTDPLNVMIGVTLTFVFMMAIDDADGVKDADELADILVEMPLVNQQWALNGVRRLAAALERNGIRFVDDVSELPDEPPKGYDPDAHQDTCDVAVTNGVWDCSCEG